MNTAAVIIVIWVGSIELNYWGTTPDGTGNQYILFADDGTYLGWCWPRQPEKKEKWASQTYGVNHLQIRSVGYKRVRNKRGGFMYHQLAVRVKGSPTVYLMRTKTYLTTFTLHDREMELRSTRHLDLWTGQELKQ